MRLGRAEGEGLDDLRRHLLAIHDRAQCLGAGEQGLTLTLDLREQAVVPERMAAAPTGDSTALDTERAVGREYLVGLAESVTQPRPLLDLKGVVLLAEHLPRWIERFGPHRVSPSAELAYRDCHAGLAIIAHVLFLLPGSLAGALLKKRDLRAADPVPLHVF